MKTILIFILMTSIAAEEATVDKIMDSLSSADNTRVAKASEENKWETEKTNWMAMLELLKDEIAKTEESIQILKEEEQELSSEKEKFNKKLTKIKDEEKAEKEIIKKINSRLNQIEKEFYPTCIDKSKATDINNLLTKMDLSMKNISSWEIVLSTGIKASGKEQVVKLIRCGSVAAWWQSLDKKEAGIATMQDNKLHLRNTDDNKIKQKINKVIRIMNGKESAKIISLPFDKEVSK